jgi:hypothetical protein
MRSVWPRGRCECSGVAALYVAIDLEHGRDDHWLAGAVLRVHLPALARDDELLERLEATESQPWVALREALGSLDRAERDMATDVVPRRPICSRRSPNSP